MQMERNRQLLNRLHSLTYAINQLTS